jgi:hypothetical protein
VVYVSADFGASVDRVAGYFSQPRIYGFSLWIRAARALAAPVCAQDFWGVSLFIALLAGKNPVE